MREDPRPNTYEVTNKFCKVSKKRNHKGYRAVSAVGVKEDVLVRFIVGV